MSLYDDSIKYWDSLKLIPIRESNLHFTDYVDLLAKEYCNGTVIFKWFQIVDGFRSNEFENAQLFGYLPWRILSHIDVHGEFKIEILKGFDVKNVLSPLHSYDLPGLLGQWLLHGGAYSKTRTGMQYYTKALDAVLDISGGDATNLDIWFGNTPWSTIHYDVAWDITLIARRKSDGKLLILIGGDTD